jgi:hypothetical protein
MNVAAEKDLVGRLGVSIQESDDGCTPIVRFR